MTETDITANDSLARANSSIVAIGASTMFILLATTLGFVSEETSAPAGSRTWILRGTLSSAGGPASRDSTIATAERDLDGEVAGLQPLRKAV